MCKKKKINIINNNFINNFISNFIIIISLIKTVAPQALRTLELHDNINNNNIDDGGNTAQFFLRDVQGNHMNMIPEYAKLWFDRGTCDYWRHDQMMEPLHRLKSHAKDMKWLTVGDGRFGLDSIRMNKMGYKDVLPTDILYHRLH